MSTTYTPTTARELANALDSDPIAASQIKEYLTTERLCSLLELPRPEANLCDFTDKEIQDELRQREEERAEDNE